MKKCNFASVALGLAYLVTGCTASSPKSTSLPPTLVQLNIRSLTAESIQELGFLSEKKDEVALVYSLAAYDAKGRRTEVNNGVAGVFNVQEGTVLAAERFDTLGLRVPQNGRVLVVFSLLEIDDATGEEKIRSLKYFTNKPSTARGLSAPDFEGEVQTKPLTLTGRHLNAAGFKGFDLMMRVTTNDDLGSHLEAFTETSLRAAPVTKTARFDNNAKEGITQTKKYLYRLNYTLKALPRL